MLLADQGWISASLCSLFVVVLRLIASILVALIELSLIVLRALRVAIVCVGILLCRTLAWVVVSRSASLFLVAYRAAQMQDFS